MIDDQWLADQLKARGLVSQQQVDATLHESGSDFCHALVANGSVRESDLLKVLGLHLQTRYITAEKLSSAKIPQWVLDYLPVEFCEEQRVIPVRCSKGRTVLSIVTADPSDAELVERVKAESGLQEVQGFVALPHAVEAAIRKFYKGDIHAFARMDEALRQSYSEMLNVYEQRLIEFSTEEETPAVPDKIDTPLIPVETESKTLDKLKDEQEPPPPAAPVEQMEPAELTPAEAASPTPVTAPSAVSLKVIHELAQVLVEHAEREQGWRQDHSAKVAMLTERVARQADLDQHEVDELQLAAVLHEVGRPVDTHLTVLTLEGSEEHRDAYVEAGDMLEQVGLPDGAMRILLAQHGPDRPPETTHAALILAAVDAYLDLLSNPNAPNGQCENSGDALRRLREAAERGTLCPRTVDLLSEVVSGDALRERLLFEKNSVLVVDPDEEAHLDLIQKLRGAGIEVRAVSNTATAARMLLEEEFAVIVCETDLEPVDGVGFLERLRADERTYQLPFIFVSQHEDPDVVDHAFDLGALDFLVKPYRLEPLLARIRRVIKQQANSQQPHKGISGSLAEMGFSELIQVLVAGKKSGRLSLRLGDQAGDVYLAEGEVVQAALDEQVGEEAFLALFGSTDGEFTFDSSQAAPEVAITRPTQELLQEALK